MRYFALIVFFLTSYTVAAPRELELWFLSAPKVSSYDRPIKFGPLLVQNDLSCEVVGDYCFDPQVGLYKKDGGNLDVGGVVLDEDLPQLPVSKSVERDLISCDPKYKFDMFCGQARPEAQGAPSGLEIWVDTSSSMREMDTPDADGNCHRQGFIQRLDKSCPFQGKVNVMMFDTSIKQASGIASLCNNVGLNDYKRLIDWIEGSKAKKLIIITDIYEFHKELADYVEAHGGKIRGDKGDLTAAKMADLASEVAKSCR